MRIIICGAGQVGWQIARQLSRERHDIVLIDRDERLIQQANDALDVQGITGHASHPDVLLCDEPTSALDAETTRALLDTLRDINARLGVTIVIVSHELSVLGAICNRVAVVENGAIAEQFDLSDTTTPRKTALGRELAYYGTEAFEATAWKDATHV